MTGAAFADGAAPPPAPEMTDRPRLLVVADGRVPTGFARVAQAIFGRLTTRFDIRQLATNDSGASTDEPWPLRALGPTGAPAGFELLRAALYEQRPDLVFLLNDAAVLADSLAAVPELASRQPCVLYCALDHGPLPPRACEPLSLARRLVCYSHWGRAQLEAAAAMQREARPGLHLPALDVLPHGVDTQTFRPLSEERAESRALARRALYPPTPEWQQAFVVLNANRNQPRKRIDLTLQGFALFARDKPAHVKLHLHMGLEAAGWNAPALARRYGIEERLALSTDGTHLPRLDDAQLNLLYNACDVGLNTSSGEGWGLTAFEHAATGAPQVLPAHSSCRELWEHHALLVEPAFSLVDPQTLLELPLVAPAAVAMALERLYTDVALRQSLGHAAYANATRPEYRWSVIAERWAGLFADVLAEQVAEAGTRRAT